MWGCDLSLGLQVHAPVPSEAVWSIRHGCCLTLYSTQFSCSTMNSTSPWLVGYRMCWAWL